MQQDLIEEKVDDTVHVERLQDVESNTLSAKAEAEDVTPSSINVHTVLAFLVSAILNDCEHVADNISFRLYAVS